MVDRPVGQELPTGDVTRPACIARNATVRKVPVAFTWSGSPIVMCTTKYAPGLP
ncbi:hypothetical protein [Streptomyces pseudovenezuelae]|uniref:Uncharacterized protein n=1 Tax=Streptomyces pseudovenezuelae TaxID=67350 RepID=A0ABT6LZ79_9ACTN|nr:hypothetical protein [Streptomyces pseudovenezuelae]MDH6221006.1 hypothetical protein [Streptomyces pseudovenezuelae]